MTKNAGKACNNRLYRHIRTFEKIVKNYFVIYIQNSPDYNDCRIFDASNKKVYAHAFTARAIEGISDMGIIRGSSGAADTDYDRLFLDGKEQKFYEYKGEKVYLSVEYAWSHDSIVSGI